MQLDDQLHLKISSVVKKKLEEEAASGGITVGALVRLVLIRHTKEGKPLTLGKRKVG